MGSLFVFCPKENQASGEEFVFQSLGEKNPWEFFLRKKHNLQIEKKPLLPWRQIISSFPSNEIACQPCMESKSSSWDTDPMGSSCHCVWHKFILHIYSWHWSCGLLVFYFGFPLNIIEKIHQHACLYYLWIS